MQLLLAIMAYWIRSRLSNGSKLTSKASVAIPTRFLFLNKICKWKFCNSIVFFKRWQLWVKVLAEPALICISFHLWAKAWFMEDLLWVAMQPQYGVTGSQSTLNPFYSKSKLREEKKFNPVYLYLLDRPWIYLLESSLFIRYTIHDEVAKKQASLVGCPTDTSEVLIECLRYILF